MREILKDIANLVSIALFCVGLSMGLTGCSDLLGKNKAEAQCEDQGGQLRFDYDGTVICAIP